MENSFERLTALQKELGYKDGELSTVAVLGLFGEAGEVMAETCTESDNSKFHFTGMNALKFAKEIDDYKKRIRKSEVKISLEIVPDHEDKFDLELADTLYYLNILAINRGLTLEKLAQMSHDKVRSKMLNGGSSEQQRKSI